MAIPLIPEQSPSPRDGHGKTAPLGTRQDLAATQADEFAYAARLPTATEMKDLVPELQTAEGNFVLGDYQLLRPVGRGGMGIVYEGCQLSLHKRVAVKVLPISSVLEQRALQRFQHEAWAAAQLDHPHIVPVHNVGYERGIHFYVMQFIDGCDLAKLISDLASRRAMFSTAKASAKKSSEPDSEVDFEVGAEKARADDSGTEIPSADSADTVSYSPDRPSPRGEGRQPTAPQLRDTDHDPRTVVSRELSSVISKFGATSHPEYIKVFLRLAIEAADALHHAHQMGIIHRDIKPSNLMVDRRGKLWVTDFGLAQIQDSPGVTATGDIVGTLRYMSPEQALGKRVTVDARTDIYSLGVTLYELLTLQPAFSGDDRETVLRKIAFDEPVAPRKFDRRIPIELETIVLKSLSKSPEERYQSAAELGDDLRRFLNDEPIVGRRPNLQQRAARWAKRNRTAAIAAAGLGGIIFISSLIIAAMSSSFYAAAAAMLKTEQEQSAQLAATLNKSEGLRLAAHASLQATANPGRATALALEAARRYSGSEVNEAILRAVNELHELRTFTGHTEGVGSIDVDPRGVLAISTPGAGSFVRGARQAHLWNLETGSDAGILSDGNPITMAVFSPDAVRVLTAGSPNPFFAADDIDGVRVSNHVRLWDSVSRRKLADLSDTFLFAADRRAFDPDGRRVVVPAYGHIAKIFDAIGGRELLVLRGHEKRVVSAVFDPSGERVATVSDDNTVRWWDSRDGRELLRLDFWQGQVAADSPAAVETLAISPDGASMATGGPLGLQFWDLQSGAMLWAAPELERIAGFAGDDQRLVTWLGADHIGFRIRDAETGVVVREVAGLPGVVDAVNLRHDGQAAVMASGPNIAVVDLVTGEVSEPFRGHESQVSAVAFVPGKDEFVSGGFDRTVRRWHLSSDAQRSVIRSYLANEAVHAVSADSRRAATRRQPQSNGFRFNLGEPESLSPMDAQLRWAAESPDRYIAFRGEFIELRATATGNLIAEHRPTEYRIGYALIGATGERIAFTDDLARVLLWDPREDRTTVLAELTEASTQIAFGPADLLAVAEPSGKLTVWDAPVAARITELQLPSIVSECRFSPSGEFLLAATVDGRITVWTTETWAEVLSLRIGSEPAVAFSFDDRYLITGRRHQGTEFACWKLASGERAATLPLITQTTDLAAAPDRHAVVIAAAPGGTVYWQYEDDEHQVLDRRPAVAARFSPTGRILVSCAVKELLPRSPRRVYAQPWERRAEFLRWSGDDLTDFDRRTVDSAAVEDFIVSDDDWLVARHRQYPITVRDLESSDTSLTLPGHSAPISFLSFMADSGDWVSTSWDQTAAVWDAAGMRKRVMREHDAPITAAAVTASGKRLLTATADGDAYLWNPETGQLLHRFRAIDSEPATVSLDAEAEYALVLGIDGQHSLYHLAEQQHLRPLGAPQRARWAELSPDRQRMLYIPRIRETFPQMPLGRMEDEQADEPTARPSLIISSLGADLRPLIIRGGRTAAARFHPIDKTVLRLNDDETLQVISRDTGATLKTLRDTAFQHFQRAGSLAISPDGGIVAVGSMHHLRLWELESGTTRFTADHIGPTLRVPETFQPFTPAGREIIFPSAAQELVRVPLQPVDYARQIAPRELTATERRRYLLDEAEVASAPSPLDVNPPAH